MSCFEKPIGDLKLISVVEVETGAIGVVIQGQESLPVITQALGLVIPSEATLAFGSMAEEAVMAEDRTKEAAGLLGEEDSPSPL
jgi:hypothetical protein